MSAKLLGVANNDQNLRFKRYVDMRVKKFFAYLGYCLVKLLRNEL